MKKGHSVVVLALVGVVTITALFFLMSNSGLTGAAVGGDVPSTVCNKNNPGAECWVPGHTNWRGLTKDGFCGPQASTCGKDCKCFNACGDGMRQPGEECGDPNTKGCGANEVCDNCECFPAPICGNGIPEMGEQCDPPTVGSCFEGNPGDCDTLCQLCEF